jgi:hypothetical protein
MVNDNAPETPLDRRKRLTGVILRSMEQAEKEHGISPEEITGALIAAAGEYAASHNHHQAAGKALSQLAVKLRQTASSPASEDPKGSTL